MAGGDPIRFGELPYRRTVEKVQSDSADFEICTIHERVVSRVPFFKKYLYIHRKEDEEGGTYWDVMVMKGGEPTHFTIGKETSDDEDS